MNLFVSFMLRAISVFIKDWILYAEQDSSHCFVSTVSEPSSPVPWDSALLTPFGVCIPAGEGLIPRHVKIQKGLL